MNLLEKSNLNKIVFATNETKRLVINKIAKVYPVFLIRLDALYYNDNNDRIATWISKYKSENNLKVIDTTDIVKYNEIIHQFIVDSNSTAIHNTIKSIKEMGQNEPGVVLKDGRIVDGNRRFTCLRTIEAEKKESQYFKAVILDDSIGTDERVVKKLELYLQHGVEKTVDYSPIDRLLGVYNYVEVKKLFTAEEYAKEINEKVASVKSDIERAKLMVDFLDFIQAPGEYYIVRELNLNDPLKALQTTLKKYKTDAEKERIKEVMFMNFIVQPFGDMTRFSRKMQKIISNPNLSKDYLEEQINLAASLKNDISTNKDISKDILSGKYSNDKVLKDKLEVSTEKWITKDEVSNIKNQANKQFESALGNLASIDLDLVKKYDSTQKALVKDNIDKIKAYLDSIEKVL